MNKKQEEMFNQAYDAFREKNILEALKDKDILKAFIEDIMDSGKEEVKQDGGKPG